MDITHTTTGATLAFSWSSLLATLKQKVQIDKRSVCSTRVISADESTWFDILVIRFGGIYVPYLLKAGSFYGYTNNSWEFWYVTAKSTHLLYITTDGTPYNRIVVGGSEEDINSLEAQLT